MKFSEVIDALKAFFLDFIGYFAPGFFTILVLAYVVLPSNRLLIDELGIDEKLQPFILVFLSYILGYVIYAIAELTDRVFFSIKFLNFKTPDDIEASILNTDEMLLCKNAMKELLLKQDGSLVISTTSIDNLNTRNLRSIAMSYIPEADIKIYTFMFRSELCKNISSASLVLGIIGIIMSIVGFIRKTPFVFNNSVLYLLVYALLIISAFILILPRMRFLNIAYKIPFSIFIAKYYKIK